MGKIKKSLYVTKYGQTIPEFTTKGRVFKFALLILELSKKGNTIGMILNNMEIPASTWVVNYKAHKILRDAVEDATAFHKAYGQNQLKNMAFAKKRHSPQMAKIWLSSFYDITEEYSTPKETASKSDKYTVETKMAQPQEVENGQE